MASTAHAMQPTSQIHAVFLIRCWTHRTKGFLPVTEVSTFVPQYTLNVSLRFGISKTMTLTAVLLICTAGIALCAGFVFLVETVVAFWLHDKSQAQTPVLKPISIERYKRDRAADKAA